MELTVLQEDTYNAYASTHPYASFLSSIYSGRKFQSKGWRCEYLGCCSDGKIQAATLLVSTPVRGGVYFYAPRGFLIDYTDHSLLREFVEALRLYMKKHNALYLKIDPYIPYQTRDINGCIVDDGNTRNDIIEALQSLSFEHQGFSVGYNDQTQCRWMSTLDLKGKDEKMLMQGMGGQCKRHIQTAIKLGIKVKELAYEELNILDEIISATSERRGFTNMSLAYYQSEYTMFEEHAKGYYAYLDVEEYEATLTADMAQETKLLQNAEEALLLNPDSKKHKGRVVSGTQQCAALSKRQKELEELKKRYTKEVPLAAGLFLLYAHEVVYLAGGSYSEHSRLKGPYAMQWYAITNALKQGYDVYNFYGISGRFKEGEDGFGVFDFKRGFNADVVELVGDFILPVQPRKYTMLNAIQSLKGKRK